MLRPSFPRAGSIKQDFLRFAEIAHSTISVWMPANPSLNGEGKDGFTRTIRVDGFSGTAAITWVGVCRRRIGARSTVGRHLDDTLPKCNGIASQAIRFAGPGNGKLYFSGLTIAAASEAA
jgi:hypothetical protein